MESEIKDEGGQNEKKHCKAAVNVDRKESYELI